MLIHFVVPKIFLKNSLDFSFIIIFLFIFWFFVHFLFQFVSISFDGTDEGIMIERIGTGAGLVHVLDLIRGVDLSIDQGHGRVRAQRGIL